ncbi:MAG: hypothetical protein L3J44_03575 [Campylobacteraceae bacterium]|nr:hypothetical protein [Campylobacteraceae bacterium]
MRDKGFILIFVFLASILVLFLTIPLVKLFISVGFVNIFTTIQDKEVYESIFLTLKSAFYAVVFVCITGIPLAYLIARYDFWGKSMLESILDIPVMVPHTAAGIGSIAQQDEESLFDLAGFESPNRKSDRIPDHRMRACHTHFGFLEQLACRSLCRRFPRIHQATGNFERHGPRAMPELPDHHQLFLSGQSDDVDPLRRFDPVEGMMMAGGGRLHRRSMHIEDLAVLEVFIGYRPPGTELGLLMR